MKIESIVIVLSPNDKKAYQSFKDYVLANGLDLCGEYQACEFQLEQDGHNLSVELPYYIGINGLHIIEPEEIDSSGYYKVTIYPLDKPIAANAYNCLCDFVKQIA